MGLTAAAATPKSTAEPERAAAVVVDYLRGRRTRTVVFQTDNRARRFLVPRENGDEPDDGDLARMPWAVSAWTTQRWAESQGAGYLLLDPTPRENAPCASSDPRTVHLANYWCKVSGLFFAMALAEEAGVEFILALDTDVFPGDPTVTIANSLERKFAENPQTHVLVVGDGGYWRNALHHLGVYQRRGAVNSGVVAFRVSNATRELLRRWFFELPLERTPWELTIAVQHVAVHRRKNFLESANVTSAMLTKTLREAFGQPAFDVELDGASTPLTLKFRIALTAKRPYVADVFHAHVVPQCCERGVCARVFGTAHAKDVECALVWDSSLVGWPGDQDRFNLLMDANPGVMEWFHSLSAGCVREGEMHAPGRLVAHHCHLYTHKFEGAVTYGSALMKELREGVFVEAGEKHDDVYANATLVRERFVTVWGRSSAAWTRLRASVRFVAFPARLDTSVVGVEEVTREALRADDLVMLNYNYGVHLNN